MKQIRVIAPQGASIRGPAVLALTVDQAKRRTAVLTPAKGKGRFHLAAGISVMFKHGEVLGIDGIDRLNLQLFQDVEAEAEAKAESDAEAEAAAKAEAEAAAKAAAASAAMNTPTQEAKAKEPAKGDAASGSLPLGPAEGASE